MTETIEKKVEISEFQFDDQLFGEMERTEKKIIKMQQSQDVLLQILIGKERAKTYEDNSVRYYQTKSGVSYEVTTREFGFR